jgi:predicted ATPase
MASTGKSEIMASIFAIASNDFMQEYRDKEETHQEPANQPAEAQTAEDEDKAPKRCQ